MSPFALSAHVDPLAVGEHGAPRLPVSGVLQRAAVVLPAVVNEGKDARCSAGSTRDGCAFLAREEGIPLAVPFFAKQNIGLELLIIDLVCACACVPTMRRLA